MRRWLWLLAAAALLAAAGLALAVRNLDAWLDAHRDEIAARAAAELGREVSFSGVGISFAGGLGVEIEDLRVGDDPAFSSEPFLVVEAVEVRMKLVPALLGRIEVERARLRSPSLTVIATAQGLSTASLGAGARADGAPAPPPSGGEQALAIALVDVEGGTLRYLDRTRRPARELVATRFDFEATDLRPGSPVAFELAAAVLGATDQNLRAKGRVGPIDDADPELDLTLALAPLALATALRAEPVASALPAGFGGVGDARLELHAQGRASALALEFSLDAEEAELRIGDAFAKPRGRTLALHARARREGGALAVEQAELALGDARLSLSGEIPDLARPAARFRASTPELALAAFGLGAAGDALHDVALEGRVAPRGGTVRVDARLRSAQGSLRGAPFRDLALEAALDGNRAELASLRLATCSGSLAARGTARLRGAAGPSFDATAELDGMRLDELLALASPGAEPDRARGLVAARLALHGAGASAAAIAPTLVGDGELTVTGGVVRGANPAAAALDALLGLPMLRADRLRALRERHPGVFANEDLAFERLDSRIEVRDERVFARAARLQAADYALDADGRVSFAGEIDAKARLAFSRPLSEELVAAEPKLRYLRAANGELELPVALHGRDGRVAVEPDVEYIAKTASREALSDALGRALGAAPGAPPPAGEAEPQEAPRKPKLKDVGRDLLQRGLGGLLGPAPADPAPERAPEAAPD